MSAYLVRVEDPIGRTHERRILAESRDDLAGRLALIVAETATYSLRDGTALADRLRRCATPDGFVARLPLGGSVSVREISWRPPVPAPARRPQALPAQRSSAPRPRPAQLSAASVARARRAVAGLDRLRIELASARPVR